MENNRSIRDCTSYRLTMLLVLLAGCVFAFLLGNVVGTLQIPFRRVLELLFHADGSPE